MKKKVFIVLTIFSVSSIILWMLSDFYGGMGMWLLFLRWILIPIILMYISTGIITLYLIITRGVKKNKVFLFSHLIGILGIFGFSVYNADFYKAPIVLDTMLIDDLNSIRISYREDGRFEMISKGMFGFKEQLSGRYKINGDTIHFLDRPYSNNYIPKYLLIVKEDSAVYFDTDSQNNFIQEKSFSRYFSIIDTKK